MHRGESRLSPAIARKVLAQFRTFALEASDAGVASPATKPTPSVPAPDARASADEALNEKEARILDLLAQGMSNKQIAATVFLAEGTVKNYVSRIMEKLHASSRLELALRAVARKG